MAVWKYKTISGDQQILRKMTNNENVDLTPIAPFGSTRTVGRLCLDTCVIIGINNRDRFVADEEGSLEKLIELRREAHVELSKTDTVGVERGMLHPNELAWQRRLESPGLVEVHGPFIPGHSIQESSVVASPDDITRFERVLQIVHPRASASASPRKNDVRDAMHIATAIRYGYQGFVTTDDNVLKATSAISIEYGGFRLLLPSQAVAWVTREVAHRNRARGARRNR